MAILQVFLSGRTRGSTNAGVIPAGIIEDITEPVSITGVVEGMADDATPNAVNVDFNITKDADWGGFKITNLATPETDNEAATLKFVRDEIAEAAILPAVAGVSSITAGDGLTGGTITSSGTIALSPVAITGVIEGTADEATPNTITTTFAPNPRFATNVTFASTTAFIGVSTFGLSPTFRAGAAFSGPTSFSSDAAFSSDATFFGDVSMGGGRVADVATPVNATDAANKAYVDSRPSGGVTSITGVVTGTANPLTPNTIATTFGDNLTFRTPVNFFSTSTFRGIASFIGFAFFNNTAAFNATAAFRGETSFSSRVSFSGTDIINMGSRRVTNLATPVNANDAANKAYVDSRPSGTEGVTEEYVDGEINEVYADLPHLLDAQESLSLAVKTAAGSTSLPQDDGSGGTPTATSEPIIFEPSSEQEARISRGVSTTLSGVFRANYSGTQGGSAPIFNLFLMYTDEFGTSQPIALGQQEIDDATLSFTTEPLVLAGVTEIRLYLEITNNGFSSGAVTPTSTLDAAITGLLDAPLTARITAATSELDADIANLNIRVGTNERFIGNFDTRIGANETNIEKNADAIAELEDRPAGEALPTKSESISTLTPTAFNIGLTTGSGATFVLDRIYQTSTLATQRSFLVHSSVSSEARNHLVIDGRSIIKSRDNSLFYSFHQPGVPATQSSQTHRPTNNRGDNAVSAFVTDLGVNGQPNSEEIFFDRELPTSSSSTTVVTSFVINGLQTQVRTATISTSSTSTVNSLVSGVGSARIAVDLIAGQIRVTISSAGNNLAVNGGRASISMSWISTSSTEAIEESVTDMPLTSAINFCTISNSGAITIQNGAADLPTGFSTIDRVIQESHNINFFYSEASISSSIISNVRGNISALYLGLFSIVSATQDVTSIDYLSTNLRINYNDLKTQRSEFPKLLTISPESQEVKYLDAPFNKIFRARIVYHNGTTLLTTAPTYANAHIHATFGLEGSSSFVTMELPPINTNLSSGEGFHFFTEITPLVNTTFVIVLTTRTSNNGFDREKPGTLSYNQTDKRWTIQAYSSGQFRDPEAGPISFPRCTISFFI